MRLLIVALSLSFAVASATSVALAAPTPESAGSVAKVSGKVQVLRNPKGSATGQTAQAKYNGQFWETYDLAEGSFLFYGDVLSASPMGKTQVHLTSGFNVILAPNAKLKITRVVIGKFAAEKTVVDLINGSLRAKSRPDEDEKGVEFRSRTLAMGVRGTDFSMSALPTETQVVVVEGEVAVRSLVRPDGPEVVLTKGQATTVTHPPEGMPPAEVANTAATFDPRPPAPATAAQARQIRDFSEGVSGVEDAKAVESLIAEKAKEEAQLPKAPEPEAKPEPSRRWLTLETYVGQRSVSSSSPGINASGVEPRLAIDLAPFTWPIAFGVSFAQTTLRPQSEFDDQNFIASRAYEKAFGFYTRGAWELSGTHALFARLGFRSAELMVEGDATNDATYHRTNRYNCGGIWLGFGYQFRLSDAFAAIFEVNLMPGSIESRDDIPSDQDFTNPSDNDWGGGSAGLGLRYSI